MFKLYGKPIYLVFALVVHARRTVADHLLSIRLALESIHTFPKRSLSTIAEIIHRNPFFFSKGSDKLDDIYYTQAHSHIGE